MKSGTKLFTIILIAAAAIGMPGTAEAHGWHGGWGGGWGVGIGIGIAPPYYYPPPLYYAPPPVYYAAPPPPPGYYSPYPGYIAQSPPPPPQQAPLQSSGGAAQSCNTGDYVCPMEVSVPVGGRCYCRGNDGNRVYGTAQ